VGSAVDAEKVYAPNAYFNAMEPESTGGITAYEIARVGDGGNRSVVQDHRERIDRPVDDLRLDEEPLFHEALDATSIHFLQQNQFARCQWDCQRPFPERNFQPHIGNPIFKFWEKVTDNCEAAVYIVVCTKSGPFHDFLDREGISPSKQKQGQNRPHRRHRRNSGIADAPGESNRELFAALENGIFSRGG
jgi:hypothetical protein